MTPKDPRSCVGTQPESSPLGIILAELALVVMVVLLICCGDGYKPPVCGIEGVWLQESPAGPPEWRYHFCNGILVQSTALGGVTISEKFYTWQERSDTVFIAGAGADPPRRWLLQWPVGEGCDRLTVVPLDGIVVRHFRRVQ